MSAPSIRRDRDETGSASIQLVILLPLFFALMLLGIQMALLHYARTIAIAAAQEGARAAAARAGRDADGIRAATSFIQESSTNGVLENVRETVTRTATTATVTISGYGLSVLPGWRPRVTQSATVTLERLTTP